MGYENFTEYFSIYHHEDWVWDDELYDEMNTYFNEGITNFHDAEGFFDKCESQIRMIELESSIQ